MCWYWLTFTNPDGSLAGVIICQGSTLPNALASAGRLGICPTGCSVASKVISARNLHMVPTNKRNVLLNQTDIQAIAAAGLPSQRRHK